MAACGSLQHIFEKPLPENPSLFSSWKRIQSMKSSHLDDSSFSSSSSSSSSFNEIFGELHFKESSSPSSSSFSSSSSFPVPIPSSMSSGSSVLTELSPNVTGIDKYKSPTTNYLPSNKMKHYRHSDSFSSMNSDSLSLCTEGLGSESFDDVEDSKSDIDNTSSSWQPHHHHHHRRRTSSIKHTQTEYLSAGESKRSRISGVEFPPPISCIGRTGKPWVCFKSYRNNGRFILKEVRIPTQEFLHACREDGRLKLQFIQSDDETIEEDDDEDEDEDEDEEEEEEEEEEGSDDLNISNEEDENEEDVDDRNAKDENQENDAGRDENRGESP